MLHEHQHVFPHRRAEDIAARLRMHAKTALLFASMYHSCRDECRRCIKLHALGIRIFVRQQMDPS